jgi:hypothetical protein
MFSPDVHAALATQRHADLLAQAAQARTVRFARLARPGRTRRRPAYGDVRGLVDDLRGYWGRRSGVEPTAA